MDAEMRLLSALFILPLFSATAVLKSRILATGGMLMEPPKKKKKRSRRNPLVDKTDIREWENLMGMHDPVLERRNHALRRKGR